MSELTPELRKQLARELALTRWAQEEDRAAATAPARRGLEARFEAQVPASLTGAARARAIESARKAHYVMMARKSAESRRARKAAAVERHPAGKAAARQDGAA